MWDWVGGGRVGGRQTAGRLCGERPLVRALFDISFEGSRAGRKVCVCVSVCMGGGKRGGGVGG